MTNIEKLKLFIKKNKLEFTEGRRNSDLVVLCGYSGFINADKAETCDSISKKLRTADLETELDRVYEYAKTNNYGEWWKLPEAKEKYKF
jgi:hypothetical protein